MNKTILSLLGAAMLYACGSTPAQTTTPETTTQEQVAEGTEVQYLSDFPTEERGGLTIRRCDMEGYSLIGILRRPTIENYDQERYPESLVSYFDGNADGQPDMITFRYIHPQAPQALGPYLYVQVRPMENNQGFEATIRYDYRLDCLNGNEESTTQIFDLPQQPRREPRRLPPGTTLHGSLNLEFHL